MMSAATSENRLQLVPNWKGITMPETTRMPNDTAKALSQNVDRRRQASRRVTMYSPSSTAMYDASPTVNAGRRMCSATTQKNWMRESRTASSATRRPDGNRCSKPYLTPGSRRRRHAAAGVSI